MTRVLLLSDIHSNLEALEAVLARVDLPTIDETWILGDVTGYGPDPAACIGRLRALPKPVVIAGNHDEVVSNRKQPIGFNPLAITAAHKNRQALKTDDLDWLKSLPVDLAVRPEIGLYHGSPVDPDEYLLTAESAEEAFQALERGPTRLGLFGHTHVPSLYDYDPQTRAIRDLDPMPGQAFQFDLAGPRRYLLNPGSVGQPRDGIPDSSFAILTVSDERAEVRFQRTPYPVAECQRKMKEAGYPDQLFKRLVLGF